MVGATGIEPVTPAMSRRCSPAELRAHPRRKYTPRARRRQARARDSGARRLIWRMDLPVATPLARLPPIVLLRPARQTTPLVFASPHSGPPTIRSSSSPPPGSIRLGCAAARTASSMSFSPRPPGTARRCSPPTSRAPGATPTASRGNSIRRCSPTSCQPGSTRPARGSAPGWARSPAWSPPARRSIATNCSFADAERRVRELLAAIPRRAGGADRRDPRQVRRLPADRLPLDADARQLPRSGARSADFVLGDAHGTACAPRSTRLVETLLAELGLHGAAQRPLRRRLHHAPLRPAARGCPRAADGDHPGTLHGRGADRAAPGFAAVQRA